MGSPRTRSPSSSSHPLASSSAVLCSPNRKLKPKMDFYLGAGFSSRDLAKLITSDAKILRSSLKKRIIPSFDFLKTLLRSNEEIITAIKYTPWLLHLDLQTNMAPNVAILRDLGVPEGRISGLAKFNADVLARKTEKFRRMTERVMEIGFRPGHHSFTVAVRCFSAISPATWETKVTAFKRFGVPEDEILSAFKKQPLMMTISEEKIKKSMGLFGLMSDKVINYQIFWLSEKKFLQRYVMRFQEQHPQVLEAYLSTTKKQL
ncbi:hypothetical protein J5N97_014574 [Dioscorea zingiberensis]|uniref:Uncharacterized protein n=1 Tax=Dioscorea zingiberensis TaxID=325984 RepID=A0A9D5CSM8_9LILI|nr:hypothetical protein J5N97_014574 [Dioscorea zingiberensis]